MIVIENISKSFAKHKVLENLSFSVDEGEFLSIVGPSGAGKTTLINMLIAAESVDEGKIWVRGTNVHNLSGESLQKYRREIAIVFQDFKLLDKLTVFENIAFALEVNDINKKDAKKRVNSVISLVELEKVKDKYPKMLSGGEKQRCSIARALVHAPDLLICDEPTGNLDPDQALNIATLLKKINKLGTTVILSTHDKEIVNYIKRRVIRIEDGKIVWDRENSNYDA